MIPATHKQVNRQVIVVKMIFSATSVTYSWIIGSFIDFHSSKEPLGMKILVNSIPFAVRHRHSGNIRNSDTSLSFALFFLFILTILNYKNCHSRNCNEDDCTSTNIFLPRKHLTHWGRDEMAAVSKTTLSNAFSWMKMFKFRLRFHWSLYLRSQSTIIQHWFR